MFTAWLAQINNGHGSRFFYFTLRNFIKTFYFDDNFKITIALNRHYRSVPEDPHNFYLHFYLYTLSFYLECY